MTTDVVVRILAVVGGGVLGGLGLGLLAQLLARAVTTKKMPRGPALIVRLLSGVICGWVIYIWLFSSGGSGIGGPGGGRAGSGSGKGNGEKTAEVAKKDGEDKKGDGEVKTPTEETLRIEVLGNAALAEQDIRAGQWYRIETKEGPCLLTFGKVQDAIKNRQQERPPLRHVEIVLYNDSPNEDVPRVGQLKAWARELDDGKMKVDISKPGADAPRK